MGMVGGMRIVIDVLTLLRVSKYMLINDAKKMLDIVRDIGTFWKQNKELIWIPNIKQGFFGITQPTEEEMAKYR
jgi:hypothetical protein